MKRVDYYDQCSIHCDYNGEITFRAFGPGDLGEVEVHFEIALEDEEHAQFAVNTLGAPDLDSYSKYKIVEEFVENQRKSKAEEE